ncbi:MAG: hypothetical protein ACPGTS_00680 [Minisyncoccia bacterium]
MSIFILLFLISATGFVILFIIERKKTQENMLHYIKKSCNIDSIQFENNIILVKNTIKNIVFKIRMRIKKTLLILRHYFVKIVTSIKMFIRKKLVVTQQQEQVSDFISEMKK